MISNEDIILDNNSGISIEEQREILAQINGIAEKNRQSLIEDAENIHDKEKFAVSAKKKSAFFPLAVNICAFIILLTAGFLLWRYNDKKDFEIRRGTGSYTIAGQTVIEELTSAQEEALATLRTLTSEQERAASLDAYISGSITVISELILNDRFDEAAFSISELRVFLNTPAFNSNRAFLSRKEFYIQSINSLEKLIEDIRRSGYSVVTALEEKNAELENTIETLEGSVESLTARNTEQAAMVTQLQDTVAEKDTSISSLESERASLTQTITALRAANAEQEAEITRLNNELARIRQAVLGE